MRVKLERQRAVGAGKGDILLAGAEYQFQVDAYKILCFKVCNILIYFLFANLLTLVVEVVRMKMIPFFS